MSEEDPNRIIELQTEYQRLLHALQSGVKGEMELAGKVDEDRTPSGPKHLRTGVSSAIIQNSGLAMLLMRKGIITETEYWETQVEFFTNEVKEYEERLSKAMGVEVHLH